jgi:hypothetical protein
MTAHALHGASKAERWLHCYPSLALEADLPDTSSGYADWGTDAHELAAICLTENQDAKAFEGRVMTLGNTVDDEMIDCVQTYVDAVRGYVDGGDLFVEQRVSFARLLGLPDDDGFGTSDAIIISGCGAEIQIHDLKTGRGVPVAAERNEQMLLYAAGAIEQFGLAYNFERVRVVIHQPRLSRNPDEWECSMLDVSDLVAKAREVIASKPTEPSPSEAACRFCKAKAICPALEREVQQAVLGDFSDLTAKAVAEATDKLPYVYSQALGRRMDAVELVEIWCKAVRARAESELLAGRRVDGWKLVEGRRGNREWRDPNAVEEALKGMRLKADDIYDRKLISPARAEKLLKDSPRRWSAISAHITQSEGKPSVAPMSDKRPAYSVADDFEDLTAPAASGPEQHPFRQ